MKIFLQARLLSLIMCMLYTLVFITIVVLNVNGVLQTHIYLGRTLQTVFDISFFIPLLFVALLLNVIQEAKWIIVSYFIFIALYFINLAISLIPVGFHEEIMITTISGGVIALYSIYVAIILFFVKPTLLLPAFKVYGACIIIALVYTFTVSLVFPLILSHELYFKIARFTSLAGIIPMLAIFSLIYKSGIILKYNDVQQG